MTNQEYNNIMNELAALGEFIETLQDEIMELRKEIKEHEC